MILIKKGKRKAEIFKGECHECGSVFSAKRKELKVQSGDQRDPGEFAGAVCTECGTSFILYPTKE